MKRYISQFLQGSRRQSEPSNTERRAVAARAESGNFRLRAEDGYDWLLQIRPAGAELVKLR